MEHTIKRFCSTDISTVCDIWNSHHAEHGIESQITPLQLELCCLSKPYFDEHDLILIGDAERWLGFAHLAVAADASWEDTDQALFSIAALCIRPDPDEDTIAAKLLAHCHEQARQRGAKRCLVKPALPHVPFYLGLGPGDSLIGVTNAESRTTRWLQKAGFGAYSSSSLWELELARFQPPMSRAQIQIRRRAQVDQSLDEPRLPWWQACVLGHTEPTELSLEDRQTRELLARALMWQVAPELLTSSYPVHWLWPLSLAEEEATVEAHLFLLANVFRQLSDENVTAIRTPSRDDQRAVGGMLPRLGFQPIATGTVYGMEM